MYNTFLLRYLLSLPYKCQPDESLSATEVTPPCLLILRLQDSQSLTTCLSNWLIRELCPFGVIPDCTPVHAMPSTCSPLSSLPQLSPIHFRVWLESNHPH